jgi:hypothetical protein
VRKDMVGAHVEDKAKSAFGIACAQDCVVYLSLWKPCTPGSSSPALINTSKGASAVTIRCVIFEGIYVSLLEVGPEFVPNINGGGEIGIAVPMESGAFMVSRFSLRGAPKAAARAVDLAEAYGLNKKKALPDQTR